MSPHPSPWANRPTRLSESPLKLDLHLKNARGVSFDPDPDWTLDDLKTELEAIEEKYSTPLLPENKPSLRSGSIFSCRDLSKVADFGRSGKPFVMRAFDDNFDSSDEDTDVDLEDRDISKRVYDTAPQDIISTSDSEAENDQLDPEVAGDQLMPRTGVVEGSLFELERERILRVQEEIRERIISSQADLEAETERSATALQLVEKDREAKRDMARRVDKQYQRKIAEARDNHLSAVQRDHQQRSQIEERRIRKEAAVEEARKREKEARENKERQEKARAEAEAKLKAEMKAAAEARKAAAEAEKKAAAEAEKKEAEELEKKAAAEAERRAALEAEKRTAAEAERKAKGEEKFAQELQQKSSPGTLSTGINVKVAETAAKLEAERIGKLKALEDQCQSLRSNANLSKELKICERQIGLRLRQITGTQEQVRAKSTELFKMITDPHVPQCILLTGFAVKAVSQCETQTLSLNSIAFALAHVIVLVTSQVPIAMDLVLAELHKSCIFTVPKYIPYSKIAFESENAYYKTVGYREDNGKIESTDNYLARMKAYVTLYAAIIQTDIPGVNNLHGVKDGWSWMARFLNALPPNRFTAAALEIFLKIAGFRLYQAYPRPFTKLLNAISREFIERLKSQNDPDSNPVISNLEGYLTSQQFRKVPEGRALPITDESKSVRAWA